MNVALGCMNFGGRTAEPEARRIIDVALERGVAVLDTANMYEQGESERIVGRALAGRRQAAQVHSKCGYAKALGGPVDLSPQAVRESLDASRQRLAVDRIDVFYLHAPDARTPLAATLEALFTARQAGHIGAFAVSNFATWQLAEICQLCDAAGQPRPVLTQVIYNLLVRQVELEHLAGAAHFGVGATIYNPLAGGLLARVHEAGAGVPAGTRFARSPHYQRRYFTDRMLDAAASYRALAEAHGLSSLELAYGWLATRPIASVIVGPGTLEHLETALAALARPVDAQLVKAVDALHAELTGTDAKYAR
jgi:aryl-alcohol dehydrogenase-like predicted oxidoreductase